MNNKQKAQKISQVLDDFLTQAPNSGQSIVGEKRALRDAISEAVAGTLSEQWGARAREAYAPWEPARQVDVDGVRALSDEIARSSDQELEHLFKHWNLERDLGI